MNRHHRESSWFASPAGRHYGLEMALVVIIKLVVLAMLYGIFIAPQPHTNVSCASMQQHLLDAPPDVAAGAPR
ncbi:MAG TPA: hypothetical protein VFN13_03015 [Rudaea sp.]|nr:hypothetical protein [Rudaea sp.]